MGLVYASRKHVRRTGTLTREGEKAHLELMLKTPLVVMMALGLAACSSQRIEPSDEPTDAVSEDLRPGCPSWGCGENSPLLGPHKMEELSWDGAPNPKSGVRLIGFYFGSPAGAPYDPEVIGDKLVVHLRSNHAITLSGSALVNGYFRLSYPATPTTAAGIADLRITSLSNGLQFWLGSTKTVETYQLEYTGADTPAGRYYPLCKNPPPIAKPGTTLSMVEGHLTPSAYEAILFTGDRYDIDLKNVTASTYAAAGHWFNIACAGGALLKLHLNRHTTASAEPGFTTTSDQRQTMLKMYTGDFCGTGEPYTEQGTKIHWTNSLGWSSSPGNTTSYESLWDKNGAVCLTTHRLHNQPTLFGDDYQLQIQGDPLALPKPLTGACRKPDCTTIPKFPNVHDTGYYLMTQSIATP